MIHMKANTRRAVALSDDLITTGSVGIEVEILCSETWDGLTKTVLFRGSGSSVDVILTGDSCTVPPEVLTVPGGELLIGLYGTDGSGSLAIPTVWADAGRILPGAVPSGVEPTPAQKSALDQAIDALNEATEEIPNQIDTALAEAKASGEFDGEDGVSPSISVTDITNGHRVTITDAEGTNVFDVMDGEKGDPGEGLAYYRAIVNSAGTLTMQADMPSPTEIANTFNTGEGPLPLLRLHDHGWFFNDTETFARIYLDLRYSQRHQSGAKYAVFEGTFENRDGSGPYHIWVKGIEENGSTTWTIGKEALGGGTPPVQSVNGKTGAVVLDAADVGAGTYSKPSGGIPKTDLANAVQTSLDKADTALQSYTETDPTVPAWAKAPNKPSYTAAEVGALPASTAIPRKTSDLTNDSGFVNASGAAAAAPVQSVNGQTGAVTVPSLPTGGTAGQVLTLMPGLSPGSDPIPIWDDQKIVVLDFTLDANDQVSSGPIWNDIDAALSGTTAVVAHITKNDGTELFAPLVFYDDTPGAWTAKFSAPDGYDGLFYSIVSGEGVVNTWYYNEWDINIDLTDLYDSKLNNNLGSAEAGKFLVVGSDGAVTTMTLATWQAGSY